MSLDQQIRYARQISLPEIGLQGQAQLQQSSVLVIGAGGLGAPLLLYLANAGIGRIGIVDADRVALSNLPRQILYETVDIGRPKTEAARDSLLDHNPETKLELHSVRLEASNASALIAAYDIIADGSDNFATRLTVNATCHSLKKPLVSAAVLGFSGQISTFKSYLGALHPCYQCLLGDTELEDTACAQAGVLGSVAGMMACWQGTEIIKELLGIGQSLSGTLIRYDALNGSVMKSILVKDAACKICAD